MASFHISPAMADPVRDGVVMKVAAVLLVPYGRRLGTFRRFRGLLSITATMFSAVNSPTPRVLFGMVVSGAAGVHVLLRVGGCAQGGAVELSRPSGPLVCKALVSSNVLWWAFWPAVPSLLGRKKGRLDSSRPLWVVFALPSVSGGSGTVEGLNFCRR